jgi:type IV secretion system protein VirD4
MKTLKRIALFSYLGVFLLVIFDPFVSCLPRGTPPSKQAMKAHRALKNLLYLMSAGMVYLIYRWQFSKGSPTTHGSARLGAAEDAKAGGNLDPRPGGLALGRVAGVRGDPRFRVRGQHVLTCAPTGAGKGVGCVIPNVLEYPGSVFVLDLKGETFAVTARRRRELGQRVHVIDPFKITAAEQRSSVNWLDWIDPSAEDSVSEAASLADTLVLRSEKGERYWDDAAVSLFQGLLLHIATLPAEERHMGTLRAILTKPAKDLEALLELISEDEKAAWGLPARASRMFLAKADKERSGVLSTAQQHTSFLDDPRVVASLQRSDLAFRTLKTEPQTVYLVIPPDKLSAYSRYARATLSLALKGLIQQPGMPELPVMFLIDEFAQLGHLASIEDGISIMRGYGGLLWLLVQDLSQLRAVYAKWETFLANTVLQAFGTQDQATAQYLSDAVGTGTIVFATETQGSSRSGSSSSTSQQRHGRPVLMPDEIRRLSGVLVLQQGRFPHQLERLDYRRDAEYQGQFDPNPMYRGAG